MSAMHLGYAEDGYVTERLIRFYEERARGGTGLIIVGGCDIDEHCYWIMLSINDDKYLPGLQELTSRVHAAGAKVGCQLFQAGRYSFSILTGLQSVAPSPVLSPLTREVPRALETQEVYEMIATFGRAAVRAKAAGFDLVEIIGSAGYLISQFLSPNTNFRTDEFGGDLVNRMRFGLEVVREVRRQVGPDFPISVRFPGHELVPNGTPHSDLVTFAKELEKAGVDMINVTGGWHESNVPQTTMNVPRGAFIYLAQDIKQAVNVPIVASNRINDISLAEKSLLNGQADLITMARGLLADPDLPRKAQEGRIKEIRKCIGCNQGCMDHVFEGQLVACLVNAHAGREHAVDISPAERKKHVLIIGGGPSGMEAARVAATRGHTVDLWESTDRLGGQLHLASVPPGRSDFKYLIEYLQNSLKVLGVNVSCNQPLDIEQIKEMAPDAIVIATGAAPIVPDIPGANKKHVLQSWDLLQHDMELGRSIAVIGGGATGCETALHIAHLGTIDDETLRFLMLHKVETADRLFELVTRGIKEVTVIEKRTRIGQDIGRSTKWVISMDLPRHGVRTLTSTKVISIEDNGVLVERDGQQEMIPADTVILAIGSRSVNEPLSLVEGLAPEIHVIGDAKKPRTAMEAIQDGFEIGNSL